MEAPVFIVIVPAEGEKFEDALPIVKAAPMAKLEAVVTVAALAIVKPLKTRVAEIVIEEPVFAVIVPPEGVRLPLPLELIEWSISKSLEVVVTPVIAKS